MTAANSDADGSQTPTAMKEMDYGVSSFSQLEYFIHALKGSGLSPLLLRTFFVKCFPRFLD